MVDVNLAESSDTSDYKASAVLPTKVYMKQHMTKLRDKHTEQNATQTICSRYLSLIHSTKFCTTIPEITNK